MSTALQILAKELFVLAYIASALAFTAPKSAWAYVNGDEGLDAPTSVVGLLGNNVLCSGIKVDSRTVLTAKHCLRIIQSAKQEVELLTKEGLKGGARSVIAHAIDYSTPKDSEADVALIIFDRDLSLWTTAHVSERELRLNDEVYLGGFGCPNERNVELAFSGSRKRVNRLVYDVVVFSDENTASAKLSFACKGDSGGPVLRVIGGRESVAGVITAIATDHSFYATPIVNENNQVLRWLKDKISLQSSWD